MMIKYFFIVGLIVALVPTAMSNISASAVAEIALFSRASVDTDSLSIIRNGDSAKMELKATNDNGKSNRLAGFQLTADNVLSTEVGDKVTVEDNVDFTKAVTTDARNNQKAVAITSTGVIDLAEYARGVYTLDVVVDDDRAYEAVVVIGDQSQQVINKEITRINNKVETDVKTKIMFKLPEDKDNDKCSNEDGSAGLKFPQNHLTECEIEEWDDCKKLPGGARSTERCDIVYEIIHDHDCFGYSSLEECNAAYDPEPEPPKETGCNDGREPVDGICPYKPGHVYCQALGCPGSPPASDNPVFPVADPMPIEPEPEPIECDEGEELVDGQCVSLDTNPVEPDDLVPVGDEDDNSDDQSIIDEGDPDESENEERDEDKSGESEGESENEDSGEESEGESEEESGGGN